MLSVIISTKPHCSMKATPEMVTKAVEMLKMLNLDEALLKQVEEALNKPEEKEDDMEPADKGDEGEDSGFKMMGSSKEDVL